MNDAQIESIARRIRAALGWIQAAFRPGRENGRFSLQSSTKVGYYT